MTHFQHIAVQSTSGPHVTLVAGVELAGRSWSTTSATAAKVRMVRRRSVAAVLTAGPDRWTLLAGRATVLDVRHPLDGLADPVAAGLAGVALARIGLSYVDQLVGYVGDRNDIPDGWRPSARVLVVVIDEHRLRRDANGVVEGTGAFSIRTALPAPKRTRRRRIGEPLRSSLTTAQRPLLDGDGGCVLGLQTSIGPVAIPAWWDAAGETVAVERDTLVHVGADVNGPCSVTIDESASARPSAKVGVMLRGSVTLLGDRARGDRGPGNVDRVLLAVRTDRITGWDGFQSATRLAG